jgi:hypothetical protein
MTLIIQKPTGAKLVMAQISQPLDADAQAYVNAVEVADRERIEDPVRFAINNFVIGCKADGIWPAIKASCILAGARTLTGALVPLVGTAPTNFNFVSGDYNRETGLVGDGSTKYLNSNRNNNADPQNNFHALTRVTSFGSTASASSITIGAGGGITGRTIIARTVATCRSTSASSSFSPSTPTAIAISRSASNEFTVRVNAANNVAAINSQAPSANAFYLFARENGSGSPELFTDCRISFYSIGESLDLALLDARVTDLINAFAAAIP